MHRATRWFLGLPQEHPLREDQLLHVETIKVEVLPQQQLLQTLSIRGRWHGGALFGSLMNGTLTIHHTTALGPPATHPHPLTPALPYLIGATQSLDALLGDHIDWAGQWIAAPDGRLPERRADLLWVKLGARRGLIDEQHPLIVIGVQDGYLVGRAYIWDENEPIEIRCLVGPLEG